MPQARTRSSGRLETPFQKVGMPRKARSSMNTRNIAGSGSGGARSRAAAARMPSPNHHGALARLAENESARFKAIAPEIIHRGAKSGWNGRQAGRKVRPMTAILQKAKAYLDARRGERVPLGELAQAVAASPFHLQRRVTGGACGAATRLPPLLTRAAGTGP